MSALSFVTGARELLALAGDGHRVDDYRPTLRSSDPPVLRAARRSTYRRILAAFPQPSIEHHRRLLFLLASRYRYRQSSQALRPLERAVPEQFDGGVGELPERTLRWRAVCP
jgi:hypothetical protein